MDTKKYLDLVGLGKYDAKIKDYIKTHGSDAIDSLVALIGASELGEKEKTLIARIAALEAGLGDVNSLEGEVKNAVAAILGEAKRAKDAEKALSDSINAIKDGTSLDSFKDVEDELVKYQLVGDYATKAEAQGYANAKDEAIAAAKKAGDDAQSDLNTYKGTVSTTYETKADATAKLTTAKGYTDTEIGKINTKIGTVAEGKTVVGLINEAKQAAIDEASYDDTQVKADIAANASAIATLNGNASTAGSVAKAVADAKGALEAKIKTNTDAIAVLNGDGEGSVSKQVADAVAGIVSDAPAAYDTLKEISDWISSHAGDASAMNSQINTNKTDIANIKTELANFVAISEDDINALFTA